MKKNIIAFVVIAVALAAILLVTLGQDSSVSWPVISASQPQDKAVADAGALINAIPSPVTLEDRAAVEAARSAYDALTDEQKAQLDEARIASAESELERLENAAAAKTVDDMIAALPAVPGEADLSSIQAARAAYDALTPEQQALVTNLDVLAAAENSVSGAADAAKAAEVDALIAGINTPVTADNREQIESARAAFDALTPEQQALCQNASLLEQLESALAAAQTGASGIEEGATVVFTGGSVYATSNDSSPAATISGSSVCTVTFTAPGNAHEYHLISTDGGGVYGWVDAASVRLNG